MASSASGSPRSARSEGSGAGPAAEELRGVHTTAAWRGGACALVVVDGAFIRIGAESRHVGRAVANALTRLPDFPHGPDADVQQVWCDGTEQRRALRDAGISPENRWALELYAGQSSGQQSGAVDAAVQTALLKWCDGQARALARSHQRGKKHIVVLMSGDGDHAPALWQGVQGIVAQHGFVDVYIVGWRRAGGEGVRDRGGVSSRLCVVPEAVMRARSASRGRVKVAVRFLDDGSDRPADDAGLARPKGSFVMHMPKLPTPVGFVREVLPRYLRGTRGCSPVERLLVSDDFLRLLANLWRPEEDLIRAQCARQRRGWDESQEWQPEVLIINGDTGCGKTTQVPQLCYDIICYQRSKMSPTGNMVRPRIVCAQPRRVACVSVAERVARERQRRCLPWDRAAEPSSEYAGTGRDADDSGAEFEGDEPAQAADGRVVGYHIMNDCACTPSTPIVYMTAGVLLQRLMHSRSVDYDVVILDEFHERTMEYDMLLMLLLREGPLSRGTRVMVMSATIDKALDRIREYCMQRVAVTTLGEPFLDPGRAVRVFDLTPKGNRVPEAAAQEEEELLRHLQDEVAMLRDSADWCDPGEQPEVEVLYLDDIIPSGRWRPKPLAKLLRRTMELTIQLCDGSADESRDGGEDKELMAQLVLAHNPARLVTDERLGYAKALGAAIVLEAEEHRRTLSRQSRRPEHGGGNHDDGEHYRSNHAVIIIFVPGWRFITEFCRYYTDECGPLKDLVGQPGGVSVHALHSLISSSDQRRAVQSVFEEGVAHKIIVSTNIAESSVTVPGVTDVIDLCLEKTASEDRDGNKLVDCREASQDCCQQRKGRAGRTNDGRCFRIVEKDQFHGYHPVSRTPEVLRISLAKSILRVMGKLACGSSALDRWDGLETIFSRLMEWSSIGQGEFDAAVQLLVRANAIKVCDGAPEYTEVREFRGSPWGNAETIRRMQQRALSGPRYRLTPLGMLLHCLPLDIEMGLLVAWAASVSASLGRLAADYAAVASCSSSAIRGRCAVFQQQPADPRRGRFVPKDSRSGRRTVLGMHTAYSMASGLPSDAVVAVGMLREFRRQMTAGRGEAWCQRGGLDFVVLAEAEARAVRIRLDLHNFGPMCPLPAVGSTPAAARGAARRAAQTQALLTALRHESSSTDFGDKEKILLMVLACAAAGADHCLKVEPTGTSLSRYRTEELAQEAARAVWSVRVGECGDHCMRHSDPGQGSRVERDIRRLFSERGGCGIIGDLSQCGLDKDGLVRAIINVQRLQLRGDGTDQDQRPIMGMPRAVVLAAQLERELPNMLGGLSRSNVSIDLAAGRGPLDGESLIPECRISPMGGAATGMSIFGSGSVCNPYLDWDLETARHEHEGAVQAAIFPMHMETHLSQSKWTVRLWDSATALPAAASLPAVHQGTRKRRRRISLAEIVLCTFSRSGWVDTGGSGNLFAALETVGYYNSTDERMVTLREMCHHAREMVLGEKSIINCFTTRRSDGTWQTVAPSRLPDEDDRDLGAPLEEEDLMPAAVPLLVAPTQSPMPAGGIPRLEAARRQFGQLAEGDAEELLWRLIETALGVHQDLPQSERISRVAEKFRLLDSTPQWGTAWICTCCNARLTGVPGRGERAGIPPPYACESRTGCDCTEVGHSYCQQLAPWVMEPPHRRPGEQQEHGEYLGDAVVNYRGHMDREAERRGQVPVQRAVIRSLLELPDTDREWSEKKFWQLRDISRGSDMTDDRLWDILCRLPEHEPPDTLSDDALALMHSTTEAMEAGVDLDHLDRVEQTQAAWFA